MCLWFSLARDVADLQKIHSPIKVFNGIEILERKVKNGLDDPRKEAMGGMNGLEDFI